MNSTVRSILGSSFFVWLALAVLGFFYLFTFQGGKFALREDRVKFGIDLIGGTYITLEVETEKAVEAELHDKIQSIKRKMSEAGLEEPTSEVFSGNKATVRFDTPQDALAMQSFIAKEDSTLNISVNQSDLFATIKEKYVERIHEWAVNGNIEVLRTRLDSLGVGEITIVGSGEKSIIVELPNVDDPQKAKAMIGKPALLEIKLVERSGSSPDEILDHYDGELPEGMIILPGRNEGFGKQYYLVPAFTDLTGRLLKDAFTGFSGQMGTEVVVNFVFKPEGGEKFYDLTRKNMNRQIAVIIDDAVISAPVVRATIGAQGQISGGGQNGFTTESANELAMLLKSGAFVAPVKFAEERQIGPALGQESINQGLIACGVGLLLLFLFSVVAYKIAGLFAFIALLYNLLLILLILGGIGATLTLPGIAGMVLTIGMAIDASVLIYEKIKEELRNGATLKKATQDGFSDAMEVIIDSNITTFIVGVVLYKFGVGPIQGFALTMMIGIVATLITGLFFLRSIFTFLLYNVGVEKIKI
jgi:preprotein translocase subunit SecD